MMATLNNNVTVNFGFAGNVQTVTGAVVVRSRQGLMRLHTGKQLSQPHYLRSSKRSSICESDWSESADACWPAAAASPVWARAEHPASVSPAIWASLVISRAITL
jgi:hypothetical protein